VTIRAELTKEEDDEKQVSLRIQVEDTGIGITEED